MKNRSGLRWGVGLLAVMLVVALAGFTALAQQTPAGTQISNQAVAQYTDTGGVERTATSNIVYVTVKQVAGVAVLPSEAPEEVKVQVLANQTVHYSFKVTNTGNGPDSFTLSPTKWAGDGIIEPESLELYRDINGNGVIDAGDTKVTGPVGPIAAGNSVDLIARFRVPADAAEDEAIKLTLRAVSVSDINVDATSAQIRFEVVTSGVLSSTLQAQSNNPSDRSSVAPGGTITYTVTLMNQGMQAVTGAKVFLAFPEGTTFMPGKPGSLFVNGVPKTLEGTNELTLPDINGGQAAVVEYTVDVPLYSAAGFITNAVAVQVGSNDPVTTNAVQTRVHHVAKVALVHNGGDHAIDPTEIGKTYSFPYTVTNDGNGPDTIYISATNDLGWPVAVYAADGVTELPKHSGQYTVGNVPAGGSADFIVKVTVPTSVKTDEGGENIVTVTATSGADSKKKAAGESTLSNFLGAGVTVDVVGDSDKSGNPGTTVEYTVEITNDGPAKDLFDLTTDKVPAGYVVEFFDENGNPISDISIDGGGTTEITVRVTIPADAAPTDPEAFDVIVTSQNDPGVNKTTPLEIGVNTVVSIEIAPNRTGAANRGGFTTYTVTLTNRGNAEATVDLKTEVPGTRRLEYVFLDPVAPNPVLGATHSVILPKGASVSVMVRVDVPTQVAVGTVETAGITATVAGEVRDYVTLTTTVLGGELQLTKKADVTEVNPGGDITYTITAKNISVGALSDVVIYEKVPAHTTFLAAPAVAGFTISYSADNGVTWDADPDDDLITDVKWEHDSDLAANGDVAVTITVKVK